LINHGRFPVAGEGRGLKNDIAAVRMLQYKEFIAVLDG
jgi:hypothetical protein